MTPFLYPRHTSALSPFALGVVASMVAGVAACGGTGGHDLFGNGGGTSSSVAGTGGGSGPGASSGTGAGTATGGAGGGSSSSGTASTSSGATTTSSATSSSGTAATSSSTSSSGTSAGCATGYTCVDDDPAGFSGHYYVTETNLPAAAAPPCPANLTAHTDHASPAGPAQCTACSCGAVTGATCSAPTLTCWPGSMQCNGGSGSDWTSMFDDGTCDADPPGTSLGPVSCKLTAAAKVTAPGSCAPSTSDFPNKGAWQQRIDACGADAAAGSCGAGKVCIPAGTGAANESLCVRHDGDVACPTGWSTVIQGYGDATDTRSCTACACGDGNTLCGDSHYTFYSTNNCTSGAISGTAVVGSNQCTNVTQEAGAGTGSVEAALPQPKGACPPSGGAAAGSVTPMSPFTYCCQ